MTSILRYYGHKRIGERTLIKRSGCTSDGATVKGLMDAARSYGITPWCWQGVSYETLCRISELGNPVMVALQAWHTRDEAPWKGYREEWHDGHFVAVTAATDEGVVAMDPSLSRARGWLARDDFLDRWHDLDMADRRLVQCAIVFPAAVVRRRSVGRVREIG